MKNVFRLLITTVVFLLFAVDLIFGCSCIPPRPPADEYAGMDVVFSGKVTNIEFDSAVVFLNKKVTIQVTETWKGDIGSTATVWTAQSGAACGYHFLTDSTYLIYGYYTGKDSIATNICTRTRFLSFADEDLAFLKFLSTIPPEHIPPSYYVLYQNYPNPFNAMTRIPFYLKNSSVVELAVFDLQGRKVKLLLYNNLRSGFHQIIFDAGNLPSGIYYYRLSTDGLTLSKKMILLQ